ncbi:hypothetical protein FZC78_22780 [Rossellomorea vietnamensis]|uniref:Uncharacterized protein n=1 Tax=Rossellomorea vietnamensis TaxID=218284 RepID=A0A5D4NHE5_9BACI|nr:hypothetical protein [Rossellomorea vietnamensis]TYS12941.1 hypothetical protein FZC78_22780 [Rossellomorea vietnamensis]
MKKLAMLLLLGALVVLPACSNNAENDNETAVDEMQNEEQSNDKNTDQPADDSVSEQEGNASNSEQDTPSDSLDQDESAENDAAEVSLLMYRPEGSEVRIFKENDQQVFTEEIIAQDEEYVQMVVTLGGSMTTEIYHWSEDEVALVYQEYTDPDQPDANLLQGFEPSTDTEVIFGESAEWELVSEGETLEVGGKTYEDVKQVKKVTDEVVGSDTIIIRYYAPGYGMVKEEMEVTGDNGYKSTVVLD